MYAAVIIETREVSGYGDIVRAHLQYLPKDWHLEVFCSAGNGSFVEKELQGLDYHLTQVVINSIKDYNQLLMSTAFWQPLTKYERILMFQTDSAILRIGVEEFLQWDYVGAPWPFRHRGGNGGFSIRNPKAMIAAIEKYGNAYPSLGLVLTLMRMKFRRMFIKNKTGKNKGQMGY
ncbi:MAG: DUF5672 family protein [Chitinophagales bacterium]|nr:DUF5672 family protein [Chitinophagales bacterium]